MRKICIIWQTYGVHHLARLRSLSCVNSSFSGIEIANNQNKYNWGVEKKEMTFQMKTMFQDDYENLHDEQVFRRVINELQIEKANMILIPGIANIAFFKIAKWAKGNNIKVIISVDSWYEGRRRNFLVQAVKRMLYAKYVDAVFCSGIKSFEYFESLGFNSKNIWKLCDVVDNDYFLEESSTVKLNIGDYRSKYDLFNQFFLYVGRFSREKNIVRLIESFNKYSKEGGKWYLVLVGDGPMKMEIKEIIERENLNIKILPWANVKQLPAIYALSSSLILPSISETWGLVVNEAMACGVPIIVSEKCGCAYDLCLRGVNGYSFNPYDVESLCNLMHIMAEKEPLELETMGRESQNIIKIYSVDNWARSLNDCIKTLEIQKEN